MKRIVLISTVVCGLFVSLASAVAQGTAFTYQGLLTANNSPVTGPYDFSFNLFTAVSGGTPVAAGVINTSVGVANGLFTTTIDFGGIFTGSHYWLEIGSRPTGSAAPFQVMVPRAELTPVPYTIFAETAGLANGVAANSVTASSLAANAVTTLSIANGTVVRSLNGLSDIVTLRAGANVSITTDGNGLQISASGSGGIALPFNATGASSNPLFSVNNTGSGTGVAGVGADKGVYGSTGSAGPNHAGVFGENSAVGGTAVVGNALNINSAGVAGVADASGGKGLYARGSAYGVFGTSDSGTGVYGVSGSADGQSDTKSAGVWGENPNGGIGVMGISEGGLGAGGFGVVGKTTNLFGAGLYGEGGFGAIAVYGRNTAGGVAGLFDGTVDVSGTLNANIESFGSTRRQMLNLYGTGYGIGVQDFTLYQRTAGGFAWYLGGAHSNAQNDPGGGTTLMTLGSAFLTVTGLGGEQGYIGGDGVGGDVQIGSLNPLISAVAAYNPNRNGGEFMDLSVRSLAILGGADVAEPFQISGGEPPKGSVVVIDQEHPGQLRLSDQPYDQRVAGVVSGANGIRPGLSMSQQGVLEGGQNVALSGRVYVLADASSSPIKPGDLLTTSDTPGHAMKATEYGKAQGAIIGKAMSALKEGKGMVLVLVSLQ